jgi:hypothetical protein
MGYLIQDGILQQSGRFLVNSALKHGWRGLLIADPHFVLIR